MVYIITRWEHAETTREPRAVCPGFAHLSYDQVFNRSHLPLATYVFSDLDRLSDFELELAAVIYRELSEAGAAVCNDPAAALMRFELLRALHREQINDFNVYRPQYQEWPERYPVFLRRCAFHQGVLTELLHSREELESALQKILGDGIPMANTMAVEYAAEAGENGVFKKFSVHKIGDHYFQDTAVTERDWVVKYGDIGAAGEDFYREELEKINTVPFCDTVQRVFEIANIDFGRVDFGMFQGRPQFYEINSNPTVGFKTEHPSQSRVQSRQTFIDNYTAAIEALDTVDARGRVALRSRVLRKTRRRCRKRIRWYHGLKSRPSY